MNKWLAVGLWMALILIASVTPMHGGMSPVWPNLGHFFEYAILGVLMFWAINSTWDMGYAKSSILAIGIATLYGFVMEVLQLFAPTRYFSIEDIAVNFTGATIATVFIRLIGWQGR